MYVRSRVKECLELRVTLCITLLCAVFTLRIQAAFNPLPPKYLFRFQISPIRPNGILNPRASLYSVLSFDFNPLLSKRRTLPNHLYNPPKAPMQNPPETVTNPKTNLCRKMHEAHVEVVENPLRFRVLLKVLHLLVHSTLSQNRKSLFTPKL